MAEDGFYAPAFSTDELAYLEAKANANDLEDAIALLKVMILRELRKRNAKMADRDGNEQNNGIGRGEPPMNAETIRRYVDTLCRAVRIRQSLGSKMGQALEKMIPRALEEIVDEWEAAEKGVIDNGY